MEAPTKKLSDKVVDTNHDDENLTIVSDSISLSDPDEAARGRGVRTSKRKQLRSLDESTSTAATEVHISGRKSKLMKPTPENGKESAEEVRAGARDSNQSRMEEMANACKTILRCIGEDENREGLLKTPERWAKALMFMTSGYCKTVEDVTNDAVFEENHKEMVIVRNIELNSLCEHHMLPFTGKVHIGYVPNGKIIGLSKLARIADLFSRRLQVQERLTGQIADAIVEATEPLGVAVVVECSHFCMIMRGVQKMGAVTTTSSVRGCFENNAKTRAEFFSLLHGGIKMC